MRVKSGRMKYLQQRFLLALVDGLIITAATMGSYLIRFDGRLPPEYWDPVRSLLPLFIALRIIVYYFFGLYSRIWAHASIKELLLIVQAVTVGSLGTTALLAARIHSGHPRSVIIIAWILNLMGAGALRLLLRIRREILSPPVNGEKRLLIVGAGEAGLMVAKEIRKHPDLDYNLIGFIDDNQYKVGHCLLGYRVLGTTSNIVDLVERQSIDEVIISMPSAPASVTKIVVNSLAQTEVRVKTLPGLYEIVDEQLTLSHIRDVAIEDLLAREPVKIDLLEVAGYLTGKTVLVTGAGGSIGSELCRQIARLDPELLVLLGHGENSIYECSQELSYLHPQLHYKSVIADVRDLSRINEVFATFSPQVVFHAAAHKHVPLMEENPIEAIKTNVFGTLNVAAAAKETKVDRFVLISTDKAVNPVNTMGVTKRVAESIVLQLQNGATSTKFMAVRFGNVLGSRGSVVPLFKEQIRRGGPVTVTHKEMTRYFMTIPEASQLVVQAGALGSGGDLFALDMGEPIQILHLAENLIRLSGYRPYKDIDVQFIGLRPGERLSEDIFNEEESLSVTKHDRIMRVDGRLSPDLEPIVEQVINLWSSTQPTNELPINRIFELSLELVQSAFSSLTDREVAAGTAD